MSKTQKSIVEMVSEIAYPIIKNLGLELWDVKFLKEGSDWYLRVFIDKHEGVTLEDCESVSRQLDDPLELLNPTNDQPYCLEVCSPGIERELSKDEHFEKFLGYKIVAKLFRPNENGEKNICGNLLSFDKDDIIIKAGEENEIKVPRKSISRINLKILEEN